MAFSVQMPALGESVTEGTVTRWLKQEGDTVEVDEPLLEVSTDKVDTEIPAPTSGVLTKIVAREDDTVEIGGELGVISEAGEAAPPPPRPRPRPRSRTGSGTDTRTGPRSHCYGCSRTRCRAARRRCPGRLGHLGQDARAR
ncbi:Probable dihydrolipoamide succinyltransferase [Mycobacteroides abscessus subsp. abscessus]|nr:Probable dihydrolipoamide succinyltransferase [Mycobacteroides abscessus subsp. abscessus]